jgi:hypothetical protein
MVGELSPALRELLGEAYLPHTLGRAFGLAAYRALRAVWETHPKSVGT